MSNCVACELTSDIPIADANNRITSSISICLLTHRLRPLPLAFWRSRLIRKRVASPRADVRFRLFALIGGRRHVTSPSRIRSFAVQLVDRRKLRLAVRRTALFVRCRFVVAILRCRPAPVYFAAVEHPVAVPSHASPPVVLGECRQLLPGTVRVDLERSDEPFGRLVLLAHHRRGVGSLAFDVLQAPGEQHLLATVRHVDLVAVLAQREPTRLVDGIAVGGTTPAGWRAWCHGIHSVCRRRNKYIYINVQNVMNESDRKSVV